MLVVTLLYPAILFIFERLDFRLLEEKDLLLAAIFCGIFAGACNGFVFWRGYSFCGTESVAKIIKKKWMPAGRHQQDSARSGLQHHRDFSPDLRAQYRAVRIGHADHRFEGRRFHHVWL